MEYKFTSIDKALEFARPLLIEGDKKVEIKKTIFKNSIIKPIDYYLVIVKDNELKKKE